MTKKRHFWHVRGGLKRTPGARRRAKDKRGGRVEFNSRQFVILTVQIISPRVS